MTFELDNWLDEHGLDMAPGDAKPRICWVDIETTGLDRDKDVILEFGMILTDEWGNVIGDSDYHALAHEKSDHYAERVKSMDDFVRGMHTKSGLLAEIAKGPTKSINRVASEALSILAEFDVQPRALYLGGNSVHYDDALLYHYAFNFEQFLHYRQVNVSSLKIMCQMLNPELYKSILEDDLDPFERHRSMSDLGDSINEYRSYIDNFLWT